MSTEERKLAAIVFTDIYGFTELMGRDENKAKESYMALLELWENADANILELIDTKKRLSKLKQTS